MMNDGGGCTIYYLLRLCGNSQTEVCIFAIHRHKGFVEERAFQFAHPHEQRRSRAILHFPIVAINRLVGILEQSDHARAPLPIDKTTGFLQAAIRVINLGPTAATFVSASSTATIVSRQPGNSCASLFSNNKYSPRHLGKTELQFNKKPNPLFCR